MLNQPAGENERILRCPDCGEVMLRQDMGFYKCPMCDGEFWPPDELEEEEDEHRQVLFCWLEDVRIPLIKKRRSSKSRRKRKKPLPPKRPWQIF